MDCYRHRLTLQSGISVMTDNNPDGPDDRRLDEHEIEWFDPWSNKLKFDKAPLLPQLPDTIEDD